MDKNKEKWIVNKMPLSNLQKLIKQAQEEAKSQTLKQVREIIENRMELLEKVNMKINPIPELSKSDYHPAYYELINLNKELDKIK